MNEDKDKNSERFLTRWSRRKQEVREPPVEPQQQTAPAVDPKAPPPELPPVEKLTIESDFRGFFHPKVNEDLRRSALKKLFADPHFNVMDGLDVYIDDYSQPNPLPAAMLAQLRQAQKIIAWAKEGTEDAKTKTAELPDDARAAPLTDQAAPPVAAVRPLEDQPQNIDTEPQSTPVRKS